jgi:hypothetical protein
MSAYIRDMEHMRFAMRFRYWIITAAALCIVGAPLTVNAGAAPEEAISLLQKRGYTAVEIEPNEEPGYEAWGCKSGTRFAIHMDAESNIIDVDPVGSCGSGPGHAAAGKDLHVNVPFADIKVGKGGLKIRAPFVNLNIR